MPPFALSGLGPQPPNIPQAMQAAGGVFDRVKRHIGLDTAQAQPAYPAQVPAASQVGPFAGPTQPFEGLPAPPPFSPGVSAPPPEGGLGSLTPPPGGTSAGWIQVPEGTRFDPSILAPPSDSGAAVNGIVTSPSGTQYGAVPKGSLVDLESQLSARQHIDALFPELTPEGRLRSARMEQQIQELTPLRPGEQVPMLPAEARAQQKKEAAFAGFQQAMTGWHTRRQQLLEQLKGEAAQQGWSKEQLAAEAQKLDELTQQELQLINLRFAPDLVPGFRANLEDLSGGI